MKSILVTGINSYVGKSFSDYMKNRPGYKVVSISMRDGSWKNEDFSGFDSVFHVAGLAHSDNGRISPEKEQAYYDINTKLTVELAKKCRAEGVGQFIYMSSAIVYGHSGGIGQRRRIGISDPVTPANCYGDSKLQAELGLKKLEDDRFKVVILRPPMIYGRGCKGNYPLLSLLARKLPFFPYVDNERSMLYIENLTEFVRLMVDNNESGTFFPQNAEYSNTSKLVRMIAAAHGKKLGLWHGFTGLLRFMGHLTPLVDKAFGNLSYDMSMSEYPKGNYRLYSLEESIRKTEGV